MSMETIATIRITGIRASEIQERLCRIREALNERISATSFQDPERPDYEILHIQTSNQDQVCTKCHETVMASWTGADGETLCTNCSVDCGALNF